MTLYANFVEKLAYRELYPIRPPRKIENRYTAPISVPKQPKGGLPSHRTPHILVTLYRNPHIQPTLHDRVTKM